MTSKDQKTNLEGSKTELDEAETNLQGSETKLDESNAKISLSLYKTIISSNSFE